MSLVYTEVKRWFGVLLLVAGFAIEVARRGYKLLALAAFILTSPLTLAYLYAIEYSQWTPLLLFGLILYELGGYRLGAFMAGVIDALRRLDEAEHPRGEETDVA